MLKLESPRHSLPFPFISFTISSPLKMLSLGPTFLPPLLNESFVEMWFPEHVICPFEACNPMDFRIFTVMQLWPQSILECFPLSPKAPHTRQLPLSLSHLHSCRQPLSYSKFQDIFLVWHFTHVGWYDLWSFVTNRLLPVNIPFLLFLCWKICMQKVFKMYTYSLKEEKMSSPKPITQLIHRRLLMP